MPEPKLELAIKYLTSTQARTRLGLSRRAFDVRIDRGIFPRPTYIDIVQRGQVTLKVRYFDEDWMKVARVILDNSLPRTKGFVTETKGGNEREAK